MPGALIPDTEKLLIMDDLIANKLTGATAHLITNTPTLSHSTVIGDLTEAAWAGYAAQSLTGWSASALDAAFRAFSEADPVQFSNTAGSGQTATGYYVLDGTGDLLQVELYPVPIVIPDGLFLQETIRHTYTSEF